MDSGEKDKIVMLAGNGASTTILYNALKESFDIGAVILEEPVSRKQFVQNRMKQLGILKAVGQVLFRIVAVPLLKVRATARRTEIISKYSLDETPIPGDVVNPVPSVNDDLTIETLKKAAPAVVIVNGTRIISQRVLDCVDALFINMHAGITPQYRGVHGAYWALVCGKKDECGVTVHFVDSGIDTGNVIDQAIIEVEKSDNFTTYPLIQLAAGIPLMKKAIRNAIEGDVETKSREGEKSRLWSHPTLFEYLRGLVLKKVK